MTSTVEREQNRAGAEASPEQVVRARLTLDRALCQIEQNIALEPSEHRHVQGIIIEACRAAWDAGFDAGWLASEAVFGSDSC